jgi:GT2 family glycosyltransferase
MTSIVIVTHNQLDYTRLCVESIERCTPEPHELIVVDNTSTDGTVEWVGKIVERGALSIEGQVRVQLVRNCIRAANPAPQ